MSDGMSRLKMLAHGLGDEIGRQNEQLDRISPTVERADQNIRDQNRQMKKILNIKKWSRYTLETYITRMQVWRFLRYCTKVNVTNNIHIIMDGVVMF